MAHETARQCMIKSKIQNKEYFDEKTKMISYNVGDKILLIDHQRKTKLHNLYKGRNYQNYFRHQRRI